MPLAAASSYPLLDAFWTIVEIFLWVIWFWILITVFIDIFRSHDLSGWGKALWFLFVLIIPLIGVLVYLIVRGDSMHERQLRQAQVEDQAARSLYPASCSELTGQYRGSAGEAGEPPRPGGHHARGVRTREGQDLGLSQPDWSLRRLAFQFQPAGADVEWQAVRSLLEANSREF